MSDLQKKDQDLTRNESGNVEVITHYLQQGGEGVELSAMQQKLLDRWRYADELIRQHHGSLKRQEIANFIKSKFEVSTFTAMNDIVNAERVFSSSYPLNKRYEIGIQIEFFKQQIKAAADKEEFDVVAKLGKVLIGLYELYPDITPQRSKKNIIMNIIQNHLTNSDNEMSVEDAIVIAENDNNE